MDSSARRAQQDSAEAQEAQEQMADNLKEAEEQNTPRKWKRGYIKEKPLMGAGGGRDGSGGLGAGGRGGRGAARGSGGVAAGGVPKRQRLNYGRPVEEDGGVADDSDNEDPQADEEEQDLPVRGRGGRAGRAHDRARGRCGRSGRDAHGVNAGRGLGESSDAFPRTAAVGPDSTAPQEVEVKKELMVEGKNWVKAFIQCCNLRATSSSALRLAGSAVLEARANSNEAGNRGLYWWLQALRAEEVATDFKEMMGTTVIRVAGDASCWLNALLATHDVINHAISDLQVHKKRLISSKFAECVTDKLSSSQFNLNTAIQ
eukprot:6183977-Pleurochrysis_carterae.AAC.2